MLGPRIVLEEDLSHRKGYFRGFSKLCRNISYIQSHSLNEQYFDSLIVPEKQNQYEDQEEEILNKVRWNVARKVLGFLDQADLDLTKDKISESGSSSYFPTSCNQNSNHKPAALTSKSTIHPKKKIISFTKSTTHQNSKSIYEDSTSGQNLGILDRIQSSQIKAPYPQNDNSSFMSKLEINNYSNMRPNSYDSFAGYKKTGSSRGKCPKSSRKKYDLNQKDMIITEDEGMPNLPKCVASVFQKLNVRKIPKPL